MFDHLARQLQATFFQVVVVMTGAAQQVQIKRDDLAAFFLAGFEQQPSVGIDHRAAAGAQDLRPGFRGQRVGSRHRVLPEGKGRLARG